MPCHALYVTSFLSPFTSLHVTRLSAIHRFVSFSLFQSFPRPSIARLYRLYDSPLTVSSFHSSCASFQSSRSPFLHTDVRLFIRGRWASAERRQSSLTVRPIHQQWCIDLHLRVFTLRKNFWSPASSPQTVCKRLVSTSSFHLSLQSYGSNPISEPLFGLT